MRTHDPPTVLHVPDAFRTIYAHAIEMHTGARQLHDSGQLGVAQNGTMRPCFARQIDAAMGNVEALLAAAGMARAIGGRGRALTIIAGAFGLQLGQLGIENARRGLDIPPTLEVRPGYGFKAMATKDLVLPPWHGTVD